MHIRVSGAAADALEDSVSKPLYKRVCRGPPGAAVQGRHLRALEASQTPREVRQVPRALMSCGRSHRPVARLGTEHELAAAAAQNTWGPQSHRLSGNTCLCQRARWLSLGRRCEEKHSDAFPSLETLGNAHVLPCLAENTFVTALGTQASRQRPSARQICDPSRGLQVPCRWELAVTSSSVNKLEH